MATRPANVPETAVPVPPGQMFGPGLGVQQATILNVEAQVSSANAAADKRYAMAVSDWVTNAGIYAGLGMPVPAPPAKPVHTVLDVVYADMNGNVVPPPEGADGYHYAWIWETTV